MAELKGNKRRGGKKKKSSGGGGWGHFGFLKTAAKGVGHVGAGTGSGFYKGITGFPTGAYMGGRAIIHDVRHDPLRVASPGYNIYRLIRGKGHTGKMAHALAQAEYDQYRHFGKHGDVSGPITDLLAILSAGGAVAGKGLAISRAMKAGETLSKASRAKRVPPSIAVPGKDYRVVASPNPLMNALQRGTMKTTRGRNRYIKMREFQAERAAEQLAGHEKTVPYSGEVELPPGVDASSVVQKVKRSRTVSKGRVALDTPMNALRLAMWARPRYYTQNIAQTGQMLATDPFETLKALQTMRKDMKENPDLYKNMKAMTGEGQAGSLLEGTLVKGGKSGKGWFKKKFPRGERMHKLGRAANEPEARVRVLSAYRNAAKEGFNTVKEREQLIKHLKGGKPGSRALNAFIRANEDVGDFGRITKADRAFMKTQIPIFYPMFKALTRYGFRAPFEHSIQYAGLQHVGRAGKEEQKRILGDLPFWAQYLVPLDAGNPNAKLGNKARVLNPSNIYNLQPGADVAAQSANLIRQGGGIPGKNLFQEVGPTPKLAFGAITGHDLASLYPLRLMSKKGILHNLTKTQIEAAVRDFVENLPLTDIPRTIAGKSQPTKSYGPRTALERFLLELGPGPAFYPPTTLLKKATQKQAAAEKRYGKGRKPRRRHHKKPAGTGF